jgi:hypothetical protein
MRKKYIFFNNPLTIVILVASIVVFVVGVPILASLWRESDFAVGFFIACISVIMVNLVFAAENKRVNKGQIESNEET